MPSRGRLIRRDGGIALLHDFAASTEFSPAGLTEADLDLRIIEITKLLIERLRGAGFSFVPLPEPAQSRASKPSARVSRRARGGRASGSDARARRGEGCRG